MKYSNFINNEEINKLLKNKPTNDKVDQILEKSLKLKGLTVEEVSLLLNMDDKYLDKLYETSKKIKQEMYGNRVVLFAPLYISNYCTNNCTYCGYKRDNKIARRKLNKEEIIKEVKILEKTGHKRLALEVGEDPINSDINFVCDAIKTIYDNSDIRRINVNIAATTTENYRRLKESDIGTYLLFQETYHKETYKELHPSSLKGNYDRQLFAHHFAQEAKIDDVGGGVLFGFYDYKYEVISLLLHNLELEKHFNVGFHTISVPRLQKAKGSTLDDYKYMINDEEFKKIIAILRISLPKVGIILSTRETKEMRELLINYGITQISAGSKTDVGGYSEEEAFSPQFELNDERELVDVIKGVLKLGKIPSYCTACYRLNRTGEKFMSLVEEGTIKGFCHANSILTLCEYIENIKDEELTKLGYSVINKELDTLRADLKQKVLNNIEELKKGKKDMYV